MCCWNKQTLSCFCVVAVYPSPLMLQPSLPKYICSFASPCAAATATTNILPCLPSSTVLGSPVSSVLWSPRSSGVGMMVTQADSLNSTVSPTQSAGALILPCDYVVSRSRTLPGPALQPVSTPLSSGVGILSSASPQSPAVIPPTPLGHFASRLASLPADVKSVLEGDSSELLAIQGGNADVVRQLCNSPHLTSIAKQLFPPPVFDARRTNESISRWKSQPALLEPDQLPNQTSMFSGRRDYLQSSVDLPLPSCQNVMRSLGQLGHAPSQQLDAQASSRYWYVLSLENVNVLVE